MKNNIVIDTSAAIALMNKELGSDIVEQYISSSVISSVIFSEIITVANREIFETESEKKEGLKLIKMIFSHIVEFDSEQAIIAASLDSHTRKYGLSLGDRACLALAKKLKLPVLTADKLWQNLDLDINVKLIR